jgi:DNA-directed RNA polymerase subunit beta
LALLSAGSEDYIGKCTASGDDPERSEVYGMTAEEILGFFYGTVNYSKDSKGWKTAFNKEGYQGQKLVRNLVDAKTKKIVANIGDKITKRAARKLEEGGLKNIFVENDELVGQYISTDIINEKNGEVYFEAGS